MDTQEAIDNKRNCIILFLKQLKIDNLPLNECCYDMKKKCDDIITLLERGEKYEQMWGELESDGKNYSYPYIATTKWLMDNIKQKHIPSSIKKTITVEIEGDNKELIEANYSIIEDYLTNYKENSSSVSIVKFKITKGGNQ